MRPVPPAHIGERYWLTRLLAVGGMAEIYLARQDAMAGFEKDVVVKRLKPELCADPRVVEMFLDEARIGALLNHPNIVHVYDVDEHEGVPYIAMEHIHGEELSDLCRRGLSHGKFLPLEHAVELMRQAAAGLGYFHAKRDARGDELRIVHLDISPSNLLVTEDGFLKVIDFGIARAANQRYRDEAIPGKLSYMSPEQATRGRVDHRSDIFSLGVVLYEITVGKRLFKGPARQVVERLTEGEIEPPTFVRRGFPGALEAVVMRALERHPGDRYQSAYDLADDLEEFLRGARLHSGPVRIARYLDELAEAAGGQRRPELVSEAEHRGDDDELDFDRGVFQGYQAAQDGGGLDGTEWDEYEESDAEVAEALGMDPAQFAALRTPAPTRAAAKDDEPDEPEGPSTPQPPAASPEASGAAGANARGDGGAAVVPGTERPKGSGAARAPAREEAGPPWLVIGGGAAAFAVVAAVLYVLLT